MTTVIEAWSAVMRDVQAIEKGERNVAQKFNFRGIDAVMNHVGPVLRSHGVVVLPSAIELKSVSYQTDKGSSMHRASVHMQYTIYGPEGDCLIGSAWGEAADSGDKAVSKATSVAYRTFLLQGLTVPTDEPDPDLESHNMASPPVTDAEAAKNHLRSLMRSKAHGMEIVKWFDEQGYGDLMKSDNVEHIEHAINYFTHNCLSDDV